MINTVSHSFGYVITAALSASFGFAIGGMMAFSKVSGLYVRINTIEAHVHSQSVTIGHLGKVLRDLLAENEESPGQHDFAPSHATLAARQALQALII